MSEIIRTAQRQAEEIRGLKTQLSAYKDVVEAALKWKTETDEMLLDDPFMWDFEEELQDALSKLPEVTDEVG